MQILKGVWHEIVIAVVTTEVCSFFKTANLVAKKKDAAPGEDSNISGRRGPTRTPMMSLEPPMTWRLQWHHRWPSPTSAAGDIAVLSPSTFSYSWEQLPTSMGSPVFDTRLCRQNRPLSSQRPTLQLAVETEKLFAGVVVNGNKFIADVFVTSVNDTSE